MLVDLECIQAFRNYSEDSHYFKDPLRLFILLSSITSLQINLPANTKTRFLIDTDTYRVLKEDNPLKEDLTCFWDSVEISDFGNLPVDSSRYYSLPKLYSMCCANTACFVVDCDVILQKPIESFWNPSQVFGNTYKIHQIPDLDLLRGFKNLGNFPVKRSNYFQGSFYCFPTGGLARTVGIGSIGYNLALWNRDTTVNVVEEAAIFNILSDLGYEIHKLPADFFYSPYMTGDMHKHTVQSIVERLLKTVAGNYVWNKFNFRIEELRGKELSARTAML